jgi:hypothetical protein
MSHDAPVKFYAVTDCRSDLLVYQHRTLQKFSLDPYELVIIDNTTPDRAQVRAEIAALCRDLGLRCLRVPADKQNHNTANEAHAHALEWMWPEVVLKDRPAYAVLYDFDMFLCKPFSVSAFLGSLAFAGWGQGHAPIHYLWPGLAFVNLGILPSPEQISWYCGRIDNVPVDVGGQLHHYLKNHPELQVKDMESTARITHAQGLERLPVLARATYEDRFGVDVMNRAFLHYVGGSGWDWPSDELRTTKTHWVTTLLEKCLAGEWEMP